jgi:hypothetical protein
MRIALGQVRDQLGFDHNAPPLFGPQLSGRSRGSVFRVPNRCQSVKGKPF